MDSGPDLGPILNGVYVHLHEELKYLLGRCGRNGGRWGCGISVAAVLPQENKSTSLRVTLKFP